MSAIKADMTIALRNWWSVPAAWCSLIGVLQGLPKPERYLPRLAITTLSGHCGSSSAENFMPGGTVIPTPLVGVA